MTNRLPVVEYPLSPEDVGVLRQSPRVSSSSLLNVELGAPKESSASAVEGSAVHAAAGGQLDVHALPAFVLDELLKFMKLGIIIPHTCN